MAVGTALAVTAGVGLASNLINSARANKRAKEEIKKQDQIAKDKKAAFEELQKNRQEVINPAANMANEFENLGVATQAAQFQAEEADMALANTLDTIAATGGGAGGATALARMALESKRGISTDIQKQEAANQKARAQGAADVAALKAQGEEFRFNAQENREEANLERLYAEQLNAESRGEAARDLKAQAATAAIGAVGQTAATLQGGFTGGPGLFTPPSR